jgi:hypothetical protein
VKKVGGAMDGGEGCRRAWGMVDGCGVHSDAPFLADRVVCVALSALVKTAVLVLWS